MSITLYVLVVVQAADGLTFSPGYTSKEECIQQYKGPCVGCFDYDPEGNSWTAFFRLADGSLRVVRKIPSEAECLRYIGAFKSDVPAACRQLAQPNTCTPVACRASEPPPPPPAAKPDDTPKPDPASLRLTYRSGQSCQVGWSQQQCTASRLDTAYRQEPLSEAKEVQIGGKQYTRVAGLAWTEATKPDSFADVSVGPTELQAKDAPDLPAATPLPPPKQSHRVRTAQRRQQYAQVARQQFDPIGAFVSLVTAPFARRDW